MMSMNIKCFIASAFNHDDVDKMYDGAIEPILKAMKIVPLRVDRVEHNEDIDNMIFKLIDEADLCIADLTYARPSVYYEAGYAAGSGKPVIYLARKDHFKRKPDDHYGNLTVHFDLQMKNIIKWSAPDITFDDRLKKRLRHVLKPILHVKKAALVQSENERKFSGLSQDDRLKAIYRVGLSILHKQGYSQSSPIEVGPPDLRQGELMLNLQKSVHQTQYNIHMFVKPVIDKKLANVSNWLWLALGKMPELNKGIDKYIQIVILLSLNTVKSATLNSMLPSGVPITDRIFSDSNLMNHFDKLPRPTIVMVIDGIRSIEGLTDRLYSNLEIIRKVK